MSSHRIKMADTWPLPDTGGALTLTLTLDLAEDGNWRHCFLYSMHENNKTSTWLPARTHARACSWPFRPRLRSGGLINRTQVVCIWSAWSTGDNNYTSRLTPKVDGLRQLPDHCRLFLLTLSGLSGVCVYKKYITHSFSCRHMTIDEGPSGYRTLLSLAGMGGRVLSPPVCIKKRDLKWSSDGLAVTLVTSGRPHDVTAHAGAVRATRPIHRQGSSPDDSSYIFVFFIN